MMNRNLWLVTTRVRRRSPLTLANKRCLSATNTSCLRKQPPARFFTTTASEDKIKSNNNNSIDTDTLHSTTTAAAAPSSSSLDDIKNRILKSALTYVHDYGWTDEAIVHAVSSEQLPPSVMAMITPTDVLQYFMTSSQEQFVRQLNSTYIPRWKLEPPELRNVSERLEVTIRLRLTYVLPFVQSNTWHTGMALGVSTPQIASITSTQLDTIVRSIVNAVHVGDSPDDDDGAARSTGGIVERAAIGALYVSTELHLLADDGISREATWTFLKSRIAELRYVSDSWTQRQQQQQNAFSTSRGSTATDAAIVANAVATSLGGAVVSLLQPTASKVVSDVAASTIGPQLLATFLQSTQSQPMTDDRRRTDGSRTSD